MDTSQFDKCDNACYHDSPILGLHLWCNPSRVICVHVHKVHLRDCVMHTLNFALGYKGCWSNGRGGKKKKKKKSILEWPSLVTSYMIVCKSYTRCKKTFPCKFICICVSPKGTCSSRDGKSLVKEIVYLLCFFNDNSSLQQSPHNFMLALYTKLDLFAIFSRYIEVNREFIYMDTFKILLFEIIEVFKNDSC